MNVERALEVFNQYYTIDENANEKIPTSIVFNRIAKELNLPRLSNIEMSEIIASYDLDKKSTTYSNYRNILIDKINKGQIFYTMTKEFKKEFIKKYNNIDRIVINAFTNVVEKLEPDGFIQNRLFLISQINTTKDNDELINVLKEYVQNHEEISIISLIENKKRKDEAVTRVNELKTIVFTTTERANKS